MTKRAKDVASPIAKKWDGSIVRGQIFADIGYRLAFRVTLLCQITILKAWRVHDKFLIMSHCKYRQACCLKLFTSVKRTKEIPIEIWLVTLNFFPGL